MYSCHNFVLHTAREIPAGLHLYEELSEGKPLFESFLINFQFNLLCVCFYWYVCIYICNIYFSYSNLLAQNLEPLKDLGILEGTKIFVWDGSQVITFIHDFLFLIAIFICLFYLTELVLEHNY